MGGTLSAGTIMAVLGGCQTAETSQAVDGLFGLSEQELLAELTEVIIPTTSTPGAKAAGVGPFIETMLKDCYTQSQRDHFKSGLATVVAEAKKLGGPFAALTSDQQISVLKTMESIASEERQQKDKMKNIDAESGLEKRDADAPDAPTPFFQLLKELTLFGYFTSEIGCTQVLAYDPIPKEYHGCIDLAPGQKAWAL